MLHLQTSKHDQMADSGSKKIFETELDRREICFRREAGKRNLSTPHTDVNYSFFSVCSTVSMPSAEENKKQMPRTRLYV